jgi:hypothetical protein
MTTTQETVAAEPTPIYDELAQKWSPTLEEAVESALDDGGEVREAAAVR